MSWPSIGIHYGLGHSQYFAAREFEGRRIFSKSLGGAFYRDPAVWRALEDMGMSEPESDSISWGSLVDLLAFRPADFEHSYAVAPATYTSASGGGKRILTTAYEGDWNARTKPCQAWKKEREAEGYTVMTLEQAAEADAEKPWNWNSTTCQAWRERILQERPGCQIVTDADITEARKAVAVLQSHPDYAELTSGAQFQVAMLSRFRGEPIRGALDILPARDGRYGDALADLKTCGRMRSRRELEKHVWEYGYHVQAWLYLSLWNALNPNDKRSRFVFAFQSSSPPYEVAVLEMDHASIAAGGAEFTSWLDLWRECNETDHWPSKWEDVETISIPRHVLEGRVSL